MLRKEFTIEDVTMLFQWIVAVFIAPFVLLPLFPRQSVSFTARLSVVIGAFAVSAVMTAIYIKARRKSRKAAARVANLTAAMDAILIFVALLVWSSYLPDAYLIYPLLIIVIGTRFGYKRTLMVTMGLCALYAVTIVARIGHAPIQTVIGDTLIRILFMTCIALTTVYVTRLEKRQRRDANIFSHVAAAIGSTLELDDLMQTVVDGVGRAAGQARCSAFLVGDDGLWALPKSTTEKDLGLRRRFFRKQIYLRMENVASRVVEELGPVVVTDVESNSPVDRGWVEDFRTGVILVLPMLIRDEVRGVVFIERRGLKKYFSDREVRTYESILAQASASLENALRYTEEQRRRSEADALYQTSRKLGSALEISQVLENACRLAISATESSGCSAFALDESTELFVPAISIGREGVRRTEFPRESGIPAGAMEDIYSLSQRPRVIQIRMPVENVILPAFLREEGVVLIAPFFSHGRMSGILCVNDDDGRKFSESQISQLAAVAGETALAFENAHLHEQIKTDAAQMASLVQLANAVGSTADLTSIMGIALDTVRHLFDCSAGIIYRVDVTDGTLRHVDSFGYAEEVISKLTGPPFIPMYECWAVAEGRLIGIDDLAGTKVACGMLDEIGEGSTICVGMQVEESTLGVLHIRSDSPGAYSEEDQQLVLAIADQVALALQRAILFEEINRLAVTDPLTGVFNVRRLEDVLQDEVSRARRYGRPLSFLMVDVDNLKSYNDTLGHQKGDVILLQVASIIDSSTRDVDKVFRYGGDEFCAILPETGTDNAMVVAQKVRRAISEFHFPHEEKIPDRSITISAGISTFPRDAGNGESLVRKADTALYSAKQGGGNSVVGAGEAGTTRP